MAFTEFYVQSGGSSLNAGSTNSNSAAYTSAAGDSDGTSVFTPNDGSTPASSVNVGDFGSVYVTAGATVCTFVGRVTAVAAGVNGAITFSTTAKMGTFPAASAGAHTITCKIGGAWAPPSGTTTFPLLPLTGFAACTNASGDLVRMNCKCGGAGGIDSAMTATITNNIAGPYIIQGYNTTPGDGAGNANSVNYKYRLDGSTNAMVLYTLSGVGVQLLDFQFSNNGTTGSNNGLVLSGTAVVAERIIVHDIRGNGIVIGTALLAEFEVYNANKSNTANTGGVSVSSGAVAQALRGVIHDCTTGSNCHGVVTMGGSSTAVIADRLVIDTVGGDGMKIAFSTTGSVYTKLTHIDAYNCTGNGISVTNGNTGNIGCHIENCNLVKNGAYGISALKGSGSIIGHILNCGYGAGTQVNSSGASTINSGMIEYGAVNYASDVTPWTDPANGDFRISLSAAKNAGRGSFIETSSSYAGTIGYPDIGAVQHQDSGGSGGGGNPIGLGTVIKGVL